MTDNVTLDRIMTEDPFNLETLYDQDDDHDANSGSDSPFLYCGNSCEYYEPNQFNIKFQKSHGSLSYFHLNCRGLSSNWNEFFELICDLHSDTFSFDFIGISEVYNCDKDTRIFLPGYHSLITRCRDDGPRGGVGLFIKEGISYKIRNDISLFIPHVFESLFIEIISPSAKNTILGTIYRPNTEPKADLDIFSTSLFEIMDIIADEHKHGIIMGDMNIDLLKFQTHSNTCTYFDNIFCHGFLPTITKPTRVTQTTATLIDHFYTNDMPSNSNSGIILNDVADHFGTFYISKSNISHENPDYCTYRSFSESNVNTFKNNLEQCNFNAIHQTSCPNDAYNKFMNLYKNAFEKAFPLKRSKIQRKNITREPWFTTGLLASSKTRRKLLTKKLQKPTEQNIQTYKNYNKLYNKTKRIMKLNYFKNILNENKYNIKNTWKILRRIISKQNDKSSYPSTFSINSNPVTNKSDIAESFNSYFSRIGIQTSRNVPIVNKSFCDYLSNPTPTSMFLEPVSPSTVMEKVNKLKPKTSSGHDDISTKLFKETIYIIINPLTHIINRSFEAGIVPDDMKIAKVIPIYKASDPSLLKNYRPISLLPAFSKLLEIMYDKLMSFLVSKNILYKRQYGFRSKHSTIHPILHFLNHCAEANNKPHSEYTLAVLCDLSKAFDVIDHKILLHKLENYGIRGIPNKWLENYLTNRQQFVQFENHKSSFQPIQCGVPQGSILGPLLYLIYVNDIENSCHSNILSFADDTTIFSSHSDIFTLFERVNKHTNDLFTWFCANRLSLNAGKTKYIIIKPRQKQCNLSGLKICINNIPLTRIGKGCEEEATKFLGILIDENLSWKQHIAFLNNKISRTLFIIKQVKHFLPCESLKTLYYSLIESHLSYGILAWGNASESIKHRTTILHKRAVRVINKANYNSHTDPLFKSSKILKFNDLYDQKVILFMHDYTANKLPGSFNAIFTFNRDLPNSHNTRQSNHFHEERCLSKFSQNLPLYNFPKIWNKWTGVLGNSSRSHLKRNLMAAQFQKYLSIVCCTNSHCKDCR